MPFSQHESGSDRASHGAHHRLSGQVIAAVGLERLSCEADEDATGALFRLLLFRATSAGLAATI